MKQQEKLNELLSTWDNKEKAEAINLLRKSMAESTSKSRVPEESVRSYVKTALIGGLGTGTLQDYTEDFSSVARSQYYKEVIREVVKEVKEECQVDTSSNPVLEAAWKDCEKARTLIELRKAFRLYIVALKSSFYTAEDVEELSNIIEEQYAMIQEYQRVQEELFGIMNSDTHELNMVQIDKIAKSWGCTDKQICALLGCNRNKLNYIRTTYELQESE